MIEPVEAIDKRQETPADPNLMVISIDLSGDRHTAKVVQELKKLAPNLKIWGIGGDHMEKQGVEIFVNNKEFAVVGMIEVARYLPNLIGIWLRLLKEIPVRKPNAVLMVDSGGFNLRFAPELKKRFPQLPLIYFISPQVWASRPWRVKTIVQTISKMLVIFPFEETLYRNVGVDAHFVGHPVLTSLPSLDSLPTREEFCKTLNLDPNKPIIAVFPGSRRMEIEYHLSIVLHAIEWIWKDRPEMQFVLSQANDRVSTMIQNVLRKKKNTPGLVLSTADLNDALMANCDIIWAKSGTTTLEATLYGKPMLVFYRGDWSSYLIVLVLKNLQRVAWPNILYKGELVPELLQLDCRAEQLVRYSLDLIDVPALRKEISEKLLTLRHQLGQGDFDSNCAREILKVLGLTPALEPASKENL